MKMPDQFLEITKDTQLYIFFTRAMMMGQLAVYYVIFIFGENWLLETKLYCTSNIDFVFKLFWPKTGVG